MFYCPRWKVKPGMSGRTSLLVVDYNLWTCSWANKKVSDLSSQETQGGERVAGVLGAAGPGHHGQCLLPQQDHWQSSPRLGCVGGGGAGAGGGHHRSGLPGPGGRLILHHSQAISDWSPGGSSQVEIIIWDTLQASAKIIWIRNMIRWPVDNVRLIKWDVWNW